MKKYFVLIFLIISKIFFSQSNLSIFCNEGKPFFTILNGIKQNTIPQTNINISGIKNGAFAVKIIFADGLTKDIDKNFLISEPSDIIARIIVKNGSGKLQFMSIEPTKGALTEPSTVMLSSNPPENINQNISTSQSVTSEFSSTSNSSSQQNNNQNGNYNLNTTNSNQTNRNFGFNMNVSDPNQVNGNIGIHMNMNLNLTDPETNQEKSNIGSNINVYGMETNSNASNSGHSAIVNQSTSVSTSHTTSYSSGNHGSSNQTNISSNGIEQTTVSGCQKTLVEAETILKEIKSLKFESDKLDLIRADLKNYCLSSSQAFKIVESLTYEADKLEISKYLFDRMLDKEMANVLLTLFSFDSTKMEFKEYMRP
jgi:hypothetical protein